MFLAGEDLVSLSVFFQQRITSQRSGLYLPMAEEVADPAVKVSKAIALCVPVSGIAGLYFLIPIDVTTQPLAIIIAAPFFQAIPNIFNIVMGSPGSSRPDFSCPRKTCFLFH